MVTAYLVSWRRSCFRGVREVCLARPYSTYRPTEWCGVAAVRAIIEPSTRYKFMFNLEFHRSLCVDGRKGRRSPGWGPPRHDLDADNEARSASFMVSVPTYKDRVQSPWPVWLVE